ncbi:hypothetical protein C5167_000093 [Papaver somniferum]|uniref:RING-type domain-containing protein n=1 Tax=Papaver somniferum TaxID=3469 RepID=A0A4Y7KSF7_PAPSO|nr:E3 ubiquitin-protein ligase dbl4-like [Papaver somniferum]RZC75747.1 hypothetical protein C5167_000093 [Papaver somniferum]
METSHNTLNNFFKTSNHNNASSSSNNCFTCEICRETVQLEQKFRSMEASGCFHPYCIDCISKYIETRVIHDNMSEIKCPNNDCSVLLDALSCRSILSKKAFEKWCHVLCESIVLLDASKGGFVYGRCFCPNSKCSELILNECVETKSMLKRSGCPNCKEAFCFSCMVRWKENHQCCQTGAIVIDIDMDRNDFLFMEMAKRKKWVQCPNCNRYIQRVKDSENFCRLIHCRCGIIFCYDCRERPCICGKEPFTCLKLIKGLLVSGFGLVGLFFLVQYTFF